MSSPPNTVSRKAPSALFLPFFLCLRTQSCSLWVSGQVRFLGNCILGAEPSTSQWAFSLWSPWAHEEFPINATKLINKWMGRVGLNVRTWDLESQKRRWGKDVLITKGAPHWAGGEKTWSVRSQDADRFGAGRGVSGTSIQYWSTHPKFLKRGHYKKHEQTAFRVSNK